jgi:hypothetical protein
MAAVAAAVVSGAVVRVFPALIAARTPHIANASEMI